MTCRMSRTFVPRSVPTHIRRPPDESIEGHGFIAKYPTPRYNVAPVIVSGVLILAVLAISASMLFNEQATLAFFQYLFGN